MFLHYSMEPHAVKYRAVIFSAYFFGQFSSNKRKLFQISRNKFDFPHCQLGFLILTLIYYKIVCIIHLLFFKSTGNGLIDSGQSFRGPKSICRWEFGKNYWNPRFFQRASVNLSHFSGLISHVWHPNFGWASKQIASVAFNF